MTQRPVIASLRRLPEALGALVRMNYELREPAPDGAADIATSAREAAALFATPFDHVDATLINRLPASVRLIASFGVGVDHIDLEAARARGVMISNTPDVTTPCLADTTIGLIIAARRRFREGLDIARTGEGRGMLTPESWGLRVSGATLGIVGMGNVGRAVAERAKPFGMAILYTTPRPSPEIDREFGARAVALDDLMREADIVTIHCPYKPQTHHLISRERLAMMKQGATIVNISRGPVIDEIALIEALKERRIGAAGLDVYETEPGPIREALHSLPNVFCLPHIASATVQSRQAMAFRVLENLQSFFAAGAPRDRVV